MDFWAKLIGGIGASPVGKSSTAKNPQQRLTQFKRYHNQLVQTWRDTPSISSNANAAETIRMCLQRLTALLDEESRAPYPHPCLAFASSSQIYTTVSKIAAVSYEDGIVREAISLFSSLIDSEEEEYLASEGFARALMALFRVIAGGNKVMLGADTEGQVVELSFGIASKIRLQPELLPIWFTARDTRVQTEGDTQGEVDRQARFAGATHKEDFPLFYLLLDYVHHEGRVGDFSRTGLLYIIESASVSPQLEHWIVESDLATLMASGLGALYSQLNRKVSVPFTKDSMPAILAFSDYSPPTSAEIETVASPEVQAHLDTFLSYLLFWQDVLEHCKSFDVRQTLLDHFQVLFLQQLLYPSLIESSDIDGGSVAVLTYLRRVLESLENPDLIHLILHYLLALPDQLGSGGGRNPRSPTAEKRRQSLILLNRATEDEEEKPTPELFNLVDLILTSLQSSNSRTVTATLRLLSSILKRHHRYALSSLLRVGPPPDEFSRRTLGAHEKEMDMLLSFASSVSGDPDMDASYEAHLQDSRDLIECHLCSAFMLDLDSGATSTKSFNSPLSQPGAQRVPYAHALRSDDPLLKALLTLLQKFLRNDVELNISLTEAIADLLSCGCTKLEGWFFVDATKYKFEEGGAESDNEVMDARSPSRTGESTDDTEKERLRALRLARRKPAWSTDHSTPFLSVLQELLDQVETYRREIPNLDVLIAGRKQAFQVSEELDEALENNRMTPERPRHSSTISASTPRRPPVMDSIPSRIANEDQINGSRSGSPRGRRGITNLYGFSPAIRPASPSKNDGRGFSPSPLRNNSLPRTPQPETNSVNGANSLKRRVDIQAAGPVATVMAEDVMSSGSSSVRSGSAGSETPHEGTAEQRQISLNHLLTNIVILQEFILELAALVQVRAGLFDELRFV